MKALALSLLCLIRLLPAADAPVEAGVVEIPAVPSDRDEAAWKSVEDQRGSAKFAPALKEWLTAHPHGVQAARAYYEQALQQENLLEAGAMLRMARGEGQNSLWGSKASLELAKLEYAQDRVESALLALDDADAWPRNEALEPDWLFWRGQCRLALKGFERARIDLARFCELFPKNPKFSQAQLGVADCDAALKQDAAALSAYERIYRDPNAEFGAQALWGAAVLRQRQGEVAEAKQLFSRLRTQYPASFEAQAAKDRLAVIAKIPQATPTPVPKPHAVSSKLYVQVGAFSKKASAVKLQKLLKARRYPVHLMGRKLGSRTLYLVKTGPYKTRAAAEAAARKIEQREKLPQRIVEEP